MDACIAIDDLCKERKKKKLHDRKINGEKRRNPKSHKGLALRFKAATCMHLIARLFYCSHKFSLQLQYDELQITEHTIPLCN